MNDMTVALPTIVVDRVKRQRKVKTLQDRLFVLALECWLEWLLQFYLPAKHQQRVAADAGIADVYLGFERAVRSNVEHSDSVLGAILSEERRGHAWPSSIHRIVLGLPKTWQYLLIGVGGRYTQEQIADAIGIRQTNVSVMIDLIKMDFLPALKSLSTTDTECRQRLGRAAF